jgi:ABC-type glycerol-3-phosphate transport system permease component
VASVIIQNQVFNTLPIGLKILQSEFTVEWGAMCAAIIVSSIPVLITWASLYFAMNPPVRCMACQPDTVFLADTEDR